MTIGIEQGKSGWKNYVLFGTKKKPRDPNKVFIIDGDIDLNEKIHQSNDYEFSYYRGVVSFDGKYTNEQAKIMYEDFKKEFFHGYEQDEYNICAVLHQDTEQTHLHFCVPKQNLKTGNELQLYMHSIDMKRKELIQDHLSLKYNMSIARETSQSLIEENKEEYFVEQRAVRNQKPFDFTMKTTKDKEAAEREVYLLVEKANIDGIIQNLDDVKKLIEQSTELKIMNEGFDRKLQKYYITFQNSDGKKYKSKGHLYDPKFWDLEKGKRATQFENNVRDFSDIDLVKRKKEVARALRLEQNKRFHKLKDSFEVARARAKVELDNISTYKKPKTNKELINESIIESVARKKQSAIKTKPTALKTEHSTYARAREERIELFRTNRKATIEFYRELTKKTNALRTKLRTNKKSRARRVNHDDRILSITSNYTSKLSFEGTKQYPISRSANNRTRLDAKIRSINSRLSIISGIKNITRGFIESAKKLVNSTISAIRKTKDLFLK